MLHFLTRTYKLSVVLQFLASVNDNTCHIDGQMKELLTLILLSYIFTLKGNNT